jgi:hypothetical protein
MARQTGFGFVVLSLRAAAAVLFLAFVFATPSDHGLAATRTVADNYDAPPASTTTSPSVRISALGVSDTTAQPARLNIAAIWGRLAAKAVAGGLRFTEDQNALIQPAKNAKSRGGLTEEEGKILEDWGNEYSVPVRGPEAHPGRGFGSNPHYHVGPVQHIPVR